MKPGLEVFLMLIAISSIAIVLAIFVHDRNLELSAYVPIPVKSSTATELPHGIVAVIDPSATGTVLITPPAKVAPPIAAVPQTKIFFSDDKVAQAWLEGYPTLSSPFTFNGTGTAFESRMSWRLRDAKRVILGEGSFDVRSPDAGIPGPFHVVGTWKAVPTTASGTLYVFESSAKDGSPIHLVTIPVTFATSTAL